MVLGIGRRVPAARAVHLLPQPRGGGDRGLEGVRARVHDPPQDPLAALRDLLLARGGGQGFVKRRRRSATRWCSRPTAWPRARASSWPRTRRRRRPRSADMMSDKKFGTAGAKLVMEEFLPGEEVSFLVFSDGARVVPMVSVQDHKRVRRRRHGPNTGGMGTVSPSTSLSLDVHKQIMQEIILPTIGGPRRGGPALPGRALRRAHDHGQGAARARVQRALRRPRDAGDHGAHALGHRARSSRAWPTASSRRPRSTGPRRRRCAWCSPPAAIRTTPETGHEIQGLDALQGRAGRDASSTPPPRSRDGKTGHGGRPRAGRHRAGRQPRRRRAARLRRGDSKVSFDGMHYRKDIGQKALARLHAPR